MPPEAFSRPDPPVAEPSVRGFVKDPHGSIGGEGTGFAQKQAEVELEEAGEAVADLR